MIVYSSKSMHTATQKIVACSQPLPKIPSLAVRKLKAGEVYIVSSPDHFFFFARALRTHRMDSLVPRLSPASLGTRLGSRHFPYENWGKFIYVGQ